MSYVSLAFLLLMAATLAANFVLPKRWRWAALLAASLVFYASAGPQLLVYLFVATATTFGAGLIIDSLNGSRRAAAEALRASGGSADALNSKYTANKRLVAAAALLINFGTLAVLKYLAPLVSNMLSSIVVLFKPDPSPGFNITLPLGISFYTFQSTGYVIDVLREKYPATRNFFKYALFVSFFPQITQGPIGRYDKLAPQFDSLPGFNAEALRDGLQLAICGLFKKLVVADRAAVIADRIFGGYSDYGGILIAFGALVYGVQIYCDFSGGIDIARGAARMFGVELAENFRRPYLATSLADYWRRWHITLGEWMREYVFYSITFSRPFSRFSKKMRTALKGRAGKVLPTALATFVVFFLIGLWHGGSPKYIVFGLWNGVIITFSQLMAAPYSALKKKLKISASNRAWYIFSLLRTLAIVTLGRYFTRAVSLSAALNLLFRTFAHPGIGSLSAASFLSLGLGGLDLAVLGAGTAIVIAFGVCVERRGDEFFRERGAVIQTVLTLLALLAVTFFGFYREGYIASEFIYKAF